MSPDRSSSDHRWITLTASGFAFPATVVSPEFEEPQPASGTRASAVSSAIARGFTSSSWQCQMAELDPSTAHGPLAHRPVGRATPLGRAAGIEDLKAVSL